MEMTEKRHLFLGKWRVFPVTNGNKRVCLYIQVHLEVEKRKLRELHKGSIFHSKDIRMLIE